MAKTNFQERLVKIKDAVVKEDEGTEEEPVVRKTLWLVLEDAESGAIFQSPLSLDDIQEIVDQIEVLKTILNDIVNKEQTIADLTYQNTQAEFFVSLEFKKAILFMDNCIEIIDGLKSIQNDLNDLGEELAEANESQENDELSLTGFDDKISAIETENAEYEAYMNKNNICLVCGK